MTSDFLQLFVNYTLLGYAFGIGVWLISYALHALFAVFRDSIN